MIAESELINAITKRDPVGAAALYDQYAHTLYKIICCSVADPKVADAVLEETMVFVWNNCRDCREQDKRLLLWMARVARQLAQKKLQSQDK